MQLQFIPIGDKEMSNGMRNMSKTPLTDDEIEFLKKEIKRIEADESVFIFNDEEHLENTCYNYKVDKVFVSRNVFPDTKYGSTHPRDIMSPAAVIALEYYGRRTYPEEFGCGAESVPEWKSECEANITAAKITLNLTEMERCALLRNAFYHAEEAGQLIELDDFMKEVVYGNFGKITPLKLPIAPIAYVRREC